jgi:peptide/nickel transport system substrate-binding protein
VREQGPFTMLWQQTEVAGLRKNVQGFKLGPTFDTNFVAPVSK